MSGCVVVNNAWRSLNKKIASHRKILFQSILIFLIFPMKGANITHIFLDGFAWSAASSTWTSSPVRSRPGSTNLPRQGRRTNQVPDEWLIAQLDQLDRELCLNYINLILPDRKKPPLYRLNHHMSYIKWCLLHLYIVNRIFFQK